MVVVVVVAAAVPEGALTELATPPPDDDEDEAKEPRDVDAPNSAMSGTTLVKTAGLKVHLVRMRGECKGW